MRRVGLCCGLLFVTHSLGWANETVPDSERQAVVGKAEGMVADKVSDERAKIRARALALYKASRSTITRSWMMPGTTDYVALRAGWRILRRDLSELTLLREEQIHLARAQQRGAPRPGVLLANSLSWPTASTKLDRTFGVFEDSASKLNVASRGIEIATNQGEAVRAVAAGSVIFAGPIRGLDQGLVIEHRQGGVRYFSVLGHVNSPTVTLGAPVERGQRVATAGGSAVYFEVRVFDGLGTTPVDPIPLLPVVKPTRPKHKPSR